MYKREENTKRNTYVDFQKNYKKKVTAHGDKIKIRKLRREKTEEDNNQKQ